MMCYTSFTGQQVLLIAGMVFVLGVTSVCGLMTWMRSKDRKKEEAFQMAASRPRVTESSYRHRIDVPRASQPGSLEERIVQMNPRRQARAQDARATGFEQDTIHQVSL